MQHRCECVSVAAFIPPGSPVEEALAERVVDDPASFGGFTVVELVAERVRREIFHCDPSGLDQVRRCRGGSRGVPGDAFREHFGEHVPEPGRQVMLISLLRAIAAFSPPAAKPRRYDP